MILTNSNLEKRGKGMCMLSIYVMTEDLHAGGALIRHWPGGLKFVAGL
jgi:hypothetical protein